jgi:hypothetical protein
MRHYVVWPAVLAVGPLLSAPAPQVAIDAPAVVDSERATVQTLVRHLAASTPSQSASPGATSTTWMG